MASFGYRLTFLYFDLKNARLLELVLYTTGTIVVSKGCLDDDEDEESSIPLKDIISRLPPCVAITPVLLTKEPVDSLIMEDEHLDTIPAMESDEVIKSSVENLVPIPSESEGIPNSVCDMPLCDHPTPLEAFKEHSEIVVDFNNDSTLSDDDSPYGEDIDYVDASPPDSEFVSLEVVENVIPKDGEIEDDILREKLLKINLLIAKIEAINSNPPPSSNFVTKSSSTSLNFFLEETNTFDNSLTESETFCFDLEENSSGLRRVNPTPSSDFVTKSPSTSPNSFLEETNISNNSLPESETFCFNLEEKISGNPTSYTDLSLPYYEAFFCDSEPYSGDFTMDVVEDFFDNPTREPRVHMPNVLPTHPTLHLDLDFTLSSDSLGSDLVVSFPSGTRNKIFDPGIFIKVQSKKFLSPIEFSISFIRDPLSLVFDTLLPFSYKNEDNIFNPGILASNEEKSPHLLSHRGFKAFQLISDISESPMMIYGEDIPILDVSFLHFYPP
ncbi:hypothetical protein Tco_1476970 [Tanacetum coccineum]